MKRILILLTAALTVSSLLQAQTNQQDNASQRPQSVTEQALQQLEQNWADAVKRRDVETINRIHADEYEFTGPGGEIWTKTRALDEVKAGLLEISSFELSDFKVRLYGETAVVNFRVVWNGKSRGIDISGPQRMTDVFVKRDGRWQCVASHTTRILSR